MWESIERHKTPDVCRVRGISGVGYRQSRKEIHLQSTETSRNASLHIRRERARERDREIECAYRGEREPGKRLSAKQPPGHWQAGTDVVPSCQLSPPNYFLFWILDAAWRCHDGSSCIRNRLKVRTINYTLHEVYIMLELYQLWRTQFCELLS